MARLRVILGLLLVAAPCGCYPLHGIRMTESGSWRRKSSASQKAEAARLEAVSRACSEGDLDEMETQSISSRYGYPTTTSTYGEITPKGFATLATRLRMSPADT